MSSSLTDQLVGMSTNTDDSRKVYNDWAQSYRKDVEAWGYDLPIQVATFLAQQIITDEEEAQQQPPKRRRQLKILDAGCGDGLSGQALREEASGLFSVDNGCYLIGADVSLKMLEVARDRRQRQRRSGGSGGPNNNDNRNSNNDDDDEEEGGGGYIYDELIVLNLNEAPFPTTSTSTSSKEEEGGSFSQTTTTTTEKKTPSSSSSSSSIEITTAFQEDANLRGSLDVISCVGTMTYVTPSICLPEFIRWVRPGGYICYTNRTDKLETFAVEETRLQQTGLWKLIKKVGPLPYLPNHPDYGTDVQVMIFLYQKTT